jgi:hypothetical protein
VLYWQVKWSCIDVVSPVYSRVLRWRERKARLDVPCCSRHTSGMEKRSHEQVGALVKARRLELGITEKRVLALTGIDSKTLRGMESGARWPQEETRMKVEPILRWAPGSIEDLREGGRATPLPDDGEEVPGESSPFDGVSDDDLLNELAARLRMLRGTDNPKPGLTDAARNLKRATSGMSFEQAQHANNEGA